VVKLQHFHDYEGQWLSIKTESDAELRKECIKKLQLETFLLKICSFLSQ